MCSLGEVEGKRGFLMWPEPSVVLQLAEFVDIVGSWGRRATAKVFDGESIVPKPRSRNAFDVDIERQVKTKRKHGQSQTKTLDDNGTLPMFENGCAEAAAA